MLLTKKELRKILQNWRVSIPAGIEEQLLEKYGDLVTDDEGQIQEYTEQDICEQLRKILRPYMKYA